jgi:hypothetical protein
MKKFRYSRGDLLKMRSKDSYRIKKLLNMKEPDFSKKLKTML